MFSDGKRNNQQSALHQHFLLFGQRIGKHRHLVLVAGFVHLEYKLSECRHVLGERSDHFRNAFTATHHDELQLAQMVVGRGLNAASITFLRISSLTSRSEKSRHVRRFSNTS